MIFKPRTWYRIAVVLSVLNLVAGGFALGQAEPRHAGIHAALALAFGFWARRLRRGRAASELQAPLEVLETLAALEADATNLRQELNETQERLDFAERLLAQRPDPHRMGPER